MHATITLNPRSWIVHSWLPGAGLRELVRLRLPQGSEEAEMVQALEDLHFLWSRPRPRHVSSAMGAFPRDFRTWRSWISWT